MPKSDPRYPYEIITAIDSQYFRFLPAFQRNIKKHFGEAPWVFDLGLSPSQRRSVKKIFQAEIPQTDFGAMNIHDNILATHKPLMLKSILQQTQKPALYLDADTLLTRSLPTDLFAKMDMAVTPRHPVELKKEDWALNGKLNTGVIYLSPSPRVFALIDEWIAACDAPQATDQSALSEVLDASIDILGPYGIHEARGLNIGTLDPMIYNDIACLTGDIFHYKKAARKKRLYRRRNRVVFLERFFPWVLKRRIERNREELMGGYGEVNVQ